MQHSLRYRALSILMLCASNHFFYAHHVYYLCSISSAPAPVVENMAAFIYTHSSYTTPDESHSTLAYQAARIHADWQHLAYTDGPHVANSDDWCDTGRR